MPSFLIVTTSILLAFLLQAGRAEEPWKALERELTSEHQRVDTQSLIELSSSDRNLNLRWMAIAVLGMRGEKQAIGTLQKLLAKDQSTFIQETAALALAKLGDSTGKERAHELISESPSLARQMFLASSLATSGDTNGFKWVKKGALSKDPRERYLSIAALIPFAKVEESGIKNETNKLFLTMAHDKEAEVRKEIFTQVPLTFGPKFEPGLFLELAKQAAKNDSDAGVRSAANNLLALWRMEHSDQE